jgi:hypothetical protein
MNSFKQFLMQEAIALSTIRAMYRKTNMWMVGKYSKVWKAHKNDNPINTNKRLYFPLVKGKTLKSNVEKEIIGVLAAAGYTVVDYLTGEVTKENDKNKYKIGRVLGKLGKADLVKAYQTDLNNLTKQSSKEEVKSQAGKEMMIVICRHFVDYIQQTEDRKWMADSCKGVTNGYTNNHTYLPMEFVGGWLVAYLCNAEDTNIQEPLARVLIIPFIKEDGSNESRLYVADENTYGTGVSGWIDRVNEIIDDIGLRKKNSFGTYTLTNDERKDGYIGNVY